MKYMLIRQDGVVGDAVQKCLQHALASGNHHCVLLRFCLFGGVVSDGLLRGDWGDDESWIQFHKVEP